ncbi:MAG: hypothetical protein ACYC54_10890 [Sedimentisphaerales bacterium]
MINFSFDFGFWDILLILVVSIQATVIAYLRSPELKALVLTIPAPFTLATMVVGTRVGSCHVAGIIILFLITCLVYVLNYRLKMPIIVAISLGALTYCLSGCILAAILPMTQFTFWIVSGVAMTTAVAALIMMPRRIENGYRSPLPVWIKFPIVMAVIVMLVIIKKYLQGFMTMFPMVGVIAMYEARYSLWTICCQMPVIMLTLLAMMITCNLTYSLLGIYGSLAAGWCVFLMALLLLYNGINIFKNFNLKGVE